ncbi:hypothetical protein ACS0TY_004154 [Phlomoides rotata]
MAAIISSSLCYYASIRDVRVNGAARSASTSPKFGTSFATGSPLSMKARLGISKASHCSQWFRDKFTREMRFAIQSQ